MKSEVRNLILGLTAGVFCAFVANALLLPADAIYLKNGRTVEGKIIREDDKSVTLEIGYGTITIKRSYIKEVIAEEWTPPKPPAKIVLPEESVTRTEDALPATSTPVSDIQLILDSYAKTPKHKEINKILVKIINLPEGNEPWQLFEELIAQSTDEAEYFLLLLKEIKNSAVLKWVILSLGKHQVPAAVKPFFEILNRNDDMLKLAVLDALRYMKDITTIHLL